MQTKPFSTVGAILFLQLIVGEGPWNSFSALPNCIFGHYYLSAIGREGVPLIMEGTTLQYGSRRRLAVTFLEIVAGIDFGFSFSLALLFNQQSLNPSPLTLSRLSSTLFNWGLLIKSFLLLFFLLYFSLRSTRVGTLNALHSIQIIRAVCHCYHNMHGDVLPFVSPINKDVFMVVQNLAWGM